MIEIVLEGPGKNALSSAMMDDLLEKLRAAYGEAVLLTGKGDAFCAGLDLREVGGLDLAGMETYLRKLEALVEALYTYPGPTVALINGHAIAGGCILALCCDHQVAADNPKIKIGVNELSLGLQFPPVSLSVVRERVPKRHLNEVVLGARLHDPQTALHLGLIDEVSSNAEQTARARLEILAGHPPATYVATKRELRSATVDSSINEQKFLALLPSWNSPEIKQRIATALKR